METKSALIVDINDGPVSVVGLAARSGQLKGPCPNTYHDWWRRAW